MTAVVEIPRNACGFFECWCGESLIELGRERAAQSFARIEPEQRACVR